jgi:integrase
VIELSRGQRFGFHNLRHSLTSFLVEIGTDSKTIQDMLRWADPSILLKMYAHSRMDRGMAAQAKMIDAIGVSEETVHHESKMRWIDRSQNMP